ncbi:polysaccharide pyruvyl transferase family protein [Agromyces albus]|uniref:Uncharacterized protein n=1 Tax=Agromyces albus TaxID=205332 RepID=A0A4Q2L435_9MICO|nr:polysaccharide pyruvyl transferase family protein [Agromyces albus]RXZ72227.1 hypothetical protein ESP51_04915 [Agromyces albus]
MTSKASIDFIIVAFRNSLSDIEQLAESLVSSANRNNHASRVIVVANDDDAYTATGQRLVIQGHGNIGFAAGVKLGVAASDADFVVVVNPDCLADEAALARFFNYLRPGCGVVVPRLLAEDGSFDYLPYENWTYSIGRKIAELRCRRELSKYRGGTLPSFAKIPGAFIGLERGVALDLDAPFDTAFFLYAEDRDLTDRVRARRLPITFAADVEITHIGGLSGTSVSRLVETAKTDGALRVALRRFGRLGAALFALDTLMVDTVKTVLRRATDGEAHRSAMRRWANSRFADPGALTEQELQRQMSTPRVTDSRSSSDGPPSPNRVLVLWADNSAANLGLRVLAQGNAELVREAAQGVEVDFQDFGPGDSRVSFGTRSILRDIGRRNGPIKTKLRQYDLILDSGAGDSFADIYGLKRLSFIAYAHWMARRLRIPLALGPQTIGPFNTVIGRAIARRSLRQAELVTSRDMASAEYARTVLKRSVDAVGTDVVFMLPTREEPMGTRDVIVNVSGLLWFGDDHVDSTYYQAQVRQLIEGLLDAGRRVSLLAHVVNSPSGNDDIDAIDAVSRSLDRPGIELLIPTDLDEARAYIASGRVLVGARMHACLNALSQGVPAIPWAYSRKFAPLLSAVRWTHVFDLREKDDVATSTIEMILDPVQSAVLAAEALDVAASARDSMAACVDVFASWFTVQRADGSSARRAAVDAPIAAA